MPRNASGIYTLPSGNPVTPGDTIDASWANSTLGDIGNELTNSLSRTGAGGMLAPFRLADGTVTAPGVSFLNETGSGLYRASAGNVWMSILGVNTALFSTNGVTVPSGKTLSVAGTLSVTGASNLADVNATHVDFDIAGSPGAVARLKWNDTDGTLDLGLKGGNVTLQIGQEQVLRARNNTGSTITDPQVVYITGATGTHPTVALAQANSEPASTKVIGVVTEPIANGADGFVTTMGLVREIDTSALTEGAVLWLSATTPGALTTTRPTAPNHGVAIGYCVRSHATQGVIFVNVQNGYELDELHDVLITSVANNNMLRYNSSLGVWQNIAGPAGAVVGTTDTQTLTNKTISGGTVTGAVVTGLATPTASSDAATKAYVDSVAEGLDAKASCVAATTGNITLSGTQTIDGVAVTAGQRVLVKDQTTTSQNGIYVAAAGAWARASDADTWAELVSAYTFIEGGTTQANNGYICTVAPGGTIGVTAVTWSQFSGAGQINAGTGMTKTGNTLNVNTASSARIVVGADEIDLATTGVTGGTYKSVTVDQWGRVTAGTNPTTLSGYGITDAYTKTYIDTLYGSTASAAASAADALTYKNAAESAATSATASASSASTSATNASTSASNASTSATNAADSASSALSSLQSFRAQYLGAASSDPTVDGNGGALTAGDLYYNTVANEMRVYSGSAWVAAYLPAGGYAALASANTFTANQTITANTSSDALKITQTGSGNALYIEDVAADATPFVVSSTGVMGIGTTTPDNVTSAGIALVSNDGYYPQVVNRNKTNDANASYMVFDKDRAGAVVQSGDNLGNIVWRSFDGTSYVQSAAIIGYSDATPGTNDAPGALSLLTTSDGASAPTERLKISNSGTAIFRNDYQETAVTANTGTAYTINIANGTVQILTLTGNCTFTFPTATAGKSFILLLKQDGTGSRTATWPAAVKWPGGTAPTITSTASKVDKYVFTADGTNWVGSNAGQNYTL